MTNQTPKIHNRMIQDQTEHLNNTVASGNAQLNGFVLEVLPLLRKPHTPETLFSSLNPKP